MGIIVASADRDLREIDDFELDLAFGADENSFALTCDPSLAPPPRGYAYIDGTEYGGTVDSVTTDTATGLACARGRTFHGILATRVLLPDAGDYALSVTGPSGDVLAWLVARMGLDGLFYANPGGARVSYAFPRFCDGYSGLLGMAQANGMVLSVCATSDGVELSLAEPASIGNSFDSELMDFTATRTARCVNHLVCAGKGEGAEREVVHLYADADGNVSGAQSLFGIDEVCELYDYPNADRDELVERGTRRLEEMQGQGSVEATVADGVGARVGDAVTALDAVTGAVVTARVAKKIVKVSCGVLTESYEVGDLAASSAGAAASGGSSGGGGGGRAYYAGRGLSLDGWTFNAEVDAADLAHVDRKVDSIGAIPIGDILSM